MFTIARIANSVKKNLGALFLFSVCSSSYAADANSPAPGHIPTPKLPDAGNFILSNSQQPGPLIGLGENVVDKGETQLFFLADNYVTTAGHQADAVPGLLYGISDSLSIFVNMPVGMSYQQYNQHSWGLEDLFVQMEYAVHATNTTTYSDQDTILASVSLPTGNPDSEPALGYGAPTYLLGATFNRTYQNWFFFGSPDVQIPTNRNGSKLGNAYLYQFGLGRNITDFGKAWIVAWMVEANGQYTDNSLVAGDRDPDSGGNVVFVTPSLWFSSKNIIAQFGVGVPVTQNLHGHQPSYTYTLAANFGWTFT